MRTDFAPSRCACGASPPGGRRQRPGKAGSAAFAWGVCAALGLVGPVFAQTSPWYIGASQTISHDNNLLRLANGQEANTGYSRADTVSSTALLGGLNQPIGRQRVFGNLTVRANRYSSNSRFNNVSYSLQGGLDWQTVERISGSVSVSASRALQSFSTELSTAERAKNQERIESVNTNVSVGLITQYSLELGGGYLQLRNSLQEPGTQSREFDQENAQLGLRWRPSSASSFGLAVATTRGRYPKFTTNAQGVYEADRFKREEVVLSMALRPTGASTIDLRLSNGRTTYDLNQQRDFSGVTGALTWSWQATGKLRLSTSYSRDTGQDSFLTRTVFFNQPTTADYSRVSDILNLRAVFDWSSKLAFTANAGYTDRDLVRTVNDPLVPPNATGSDRTTTVGLGVRWSPRRYATLGCDLSGERRTGIGELTSSLGATGFSCFGQATLQ